MRPIPAILWLCACLALLPNCSERQADAHIEAPTIEGEIIRFHAGSPQLAYLIVEPAQKHTFAVNGLTGRLAWNDDVTARIYPPVSGRIVEILAQPGQRVAVGDVLAKIHSHDFGQAQVDVLNAKTNLRQAERALARVRELFEHKAAARKDVEAAEAEYAHALSEEKRALATLALYGGDANASTVTAIFSLKSPVNGVVVEKAVNPGKEVRSDQVGENPLFIISDPTKLWLFLYMTESDTAMLKINQNVRIRTRNDPDTVFSGRIENISEGLDASTRMVKARCIVDSPDKKLRAEMYVTAGVGADSTPKINVDTHSILLKEGRRYLFVETAAGEFQRREVKVGTESKGRSVILEGLSEEERVVSEGVLLLQTLLEESGSL